MTASYHKLKAWETDGMVASYLHWCKIRLRDSCGDIGSKSIVRVENWTNSFVEFVPVRHLLVPLLKNVSMRAASFYMNQILEEHTGKQEGTEQSREFTAQGCLKIRTRSIGRR
jgi:hypothetical protein